MDTKKFVQIGIIASIGMTGLAGCNGIQNKDDSYDPSDNENQDVYGPPVEEEEFNAEENENTCVYGPPEEMSNEQD